MEYENTQVIVPKIVSILFKNYLLLAINSWCLDGKHKWVNPEGRGSFCKVNISLLDTMDMLFRDPIFGILTSLNLLTIKRIFLFKQDLQKDI